MVLGVGFACSDPAMEGLPFVPPAGDPDGGTVRGTLTTDVTSTQEGRLYLGVFASSEATALSAAAAAREVAFPYDYEVSQVPAGSAIIRALLDLPPYGCHPFSDPPGPEDATGVFLNTNSVVPVTIRPGAITSRIDFSVTRGN
jgi:hypothetical protein